MKRKIILVLFGLIDLLLILGIIYFVKKTGTLRQTSGSGESALIAVSEGLPSALADSSEELFSAASDTAEEASAFVSGAAEAAAAPADYYETPEGEIVADRDQDDEESFAEPLLMTGESVTGSAEPLIIAGESVASLAEPLIIAGESVMSSAGPPEPADSLSLSDLSAGSVPEDTEEISEVLSDISGILSEAEAAETPAESGTALSELPPTRRCLVDGTFWEGCPERDIQLLTPNPYSRPQYALEEVHDIVIHYVGNAGSTAQQNRDYFESLQDGSRSASSHFVIGLEGEIIQCVSCSEWSYATNNRNFDTISIECCHPDESGKFNDATYRSVVDLAAWLCKAFGIGPEHVIRHYDVTGKICPKYYVENEEAWDRMLADICAKYEEHVSE